MAVFLIGYCFLSVRKRSSTSSPRWNSKSARYSTGVACLLCLRISQCFEGRLDATRASQLITRECTVSAYQLVRQLARHSKVSKSSQVLEPRRLTIREAPVGFLSLDGNF